MSQRTYSTVTSLCLILSVASAFGYDRASHPAWLVLGGSAASLAIATYFVQHWRRTRPAERTTESPDVLPTIGWTTKRFSHDEHAWPNPVVKAYLEGHKSILDQPYVAFPLVHRKSPYYDPAALAARVIGELLRSTHKPRELVIAPRPDGTISVKFSTSDAEPTELPSRLEPNLKVSETVH